MKKYLLAIIVVVVLSVGVIVGLVLVKNTALFNQKASTPSGTATVSLSPSTGNVNLNTPSQVSVSFNTGGISISGVAIRLAFSNDGVKASNIQINQALLTDSAHSWSCPVKSISDNGSTENVDFGCTDTSTAGFSSTSDTLLATFDLTASQVPVVNPVIISFDPAITQITQKSDASDIALTPTSTGSFTVNGNISQSPTPTPTIIVSTPSPTPSLIGQATNTPAPTNTAPAAPTTNATTAPTSTATTSSATTSPTNTSAPALPVTGFDTPTIIGGGAGVLLLMSAAAALIL